MSFLSRRVLRLPVFPFRNGVSSRTHNLFLGVGQKRLNSTVVEDVAPIFIQKPPAWVRFAWPIIIANALLMGSAIEITWNHWATLVQDLEAVAEKNRQDTGTIVVTGSPPAPVEDTQKTKEVYHWEVRPTWQRAGFCGIYALGWAFSTAYLLKYRQTYVTKLKFFRAPLPPSDLGSNLSTTVSSSTIPSMDAPIKQKLKLKRMVQISTASNTAGVTIPLNDLTIQDGRNETELVIRTKDVTDEKGKVVKRKRDYWFVSLTDAIVDGAKFSSHESARDQVLYAWDGIGGAERKTHVLSGFRSGPVVKG